MKEFVIPMDKIRENDRDIIGSKAFSLHRIIEAGMKVPAFTCITTKAYKMYLESTALKGKIILEISRKDIKDMRWEEMWDMSLRVRSMFLNTPIPEFLEKELRKKIGEYYSDIPVVVRSSAPGEDSAKTSFAGLHESYVNIQGLESILEHIRLVWASLWSDAALLYRKELNLEIESSRMSVVVQELIDGEVSGIIFSSSPEDSSYMVIEAVHGLNKGLVDGDVEPDRWIIDRKEASFIRHTSPSNRDKVVRLQDTGTVLERTDEFKNRIPLNENEILELHRIALTLEKIYEQAQDIEWTKSNDETYVLQSRPITTSTDSEKLWYLSLRRTIDNLRDLRKRIEHELIPQMIKDTRILQSADLTQMNNRQLAREIIQRKELYESWNKKYTDEFIPFAHGMRLFGQVYNDMVRPSNPYEFMNLLSGSGLLSIKRNEAFKKFALKLRKDPTILSKAKKNNMPKELMGDVGEIFNNFGHSGIFKTKEELLKHMVELASSPQRDIPEKSEIRHLENRFFSAFSKKDRDFAEELLDMGRTSYRLRDDDNIYLARIEVQYLISLNEAKMRVFSRIPDFDIDDDIEEDELLKALKNETHIPAKKVRISKEIHSSESKENVRQIQGQPAGEGLVTGIARVITKNEEFLNVRFGEILVCDAIDPNMTFVVPLVSGIVERRGGMLIHGAIIAREYGIPCVTGIPNATMIITNGDEVTVDGYLGIVTIKRKMK